MMSATTLPETRPELLLVDDDPAFCRVLARAMERRGLRVRQAHSVPTAHALAAAAAPDYALIDLNMPDGSGLALIPVLKQLREDMRIVVLTGYASIATAVEAIKLGATHYLAKPADAGDILEAFELGQGDVDVPIDTTPATLNRLEWEYIQKVLRDNQGNISATARALRMHRRTLQRKLAKRPLKS